MSDSEKVNFKRALEIVGSLFISLYFLFTYGGPLANLVVKINIPSVLIESRNISLFTYIRGLVVSYILPSILAGFLAGYLTKLKIWRSSLALFLLAIIYGTVEAFYLFPKTFANTGIKSFGYSFSLRQLFLCLVVFSGIGIGNYVSYNTKGTGIGRNFFIFILILLLLKVPNIVSEIFISPFRKGEMDIAQIYIVSARTIVLEYLIFIIYAIIGMVVVLLSHRWGILLLFLACISYSFGLFGTPHIIYSDVTRQFYYFLHICGRVILPAIIAWFSLPFVAGYKGFKKVVMFAALVVVSAALIAFIEERISRPRADLVDVKTYAIQNNDPIGKGPIEVGDGSISQNGDHIFVIYSGKEGGKSGVYHIRVFSEDGKQKDFLLPCKSFGYKLRGEWSPNGRYIVLESFPRELPFEASMTQKGEVWLLDTENGKLKLISKASYNRVFLYSRWNIESTAFLISEYLSKPGYFCLKVSDLRGNKETIIEFKIGQPPASFNLGALWDKIDGNIYIWKWDEGVFKISYPKGEIEKIYDSPELKDFYDFSLLLNPRAGIALFAKEGLILSGDNSEGSFMFYELRKHRGLFSLRKETRTSNLEGVFLSPPFLRLSPKENAVFFLPKYNLTYTICIFTLSNRGKVKVHNVALPLPYIHIFGADWGEDERIIYLATSSWEEEWAFSNNKKIQLYKISLKY